MWRGGLRQHLDGAGRGKLEGLALGVPAGGLAFAIAQGVGVGSEGKGHGDVMHSRARGGQEKPAGAGSMHLPARPRLRALQLLHRPQNPPPHALLLDMILVYSVLSLGLSPLLVS